MTEKLPEVRVHAANGKRKEFCFSFEDVECNESGMVDQKAGEFKD